MLKAMSLATATGAPFASTTGPEENCGIHARRTLSLAFGPEQCSTLSDMNSTSPARIVIVLTRLNA